MPHWLALQQVVASVSIRSDSAGCSSRNETPTFRGRDSIIGKARFSSKKSQDGLSYRIVVLGSVETKIIDDASQSLGSNASYETHTFLSHTVCDCNSTYASTDVELPFVFTLQDLPRSSYRTNSTAISQPLLPTVDSKHASRHWSDTFKSGSTTYYQITYAIIASALVDKKVISSAAKRFHYMPTTPSPASFPAEDYPEEYVLRASKLQQKRSSISRLGIISQEPAPLTVSNGTWYASTNIKLLLMLARRQSAEVPLRPKIFSVRAQLRTLTFVMRKPATIAMHAMNARSNNVPIIRQEKSKPQVHTGVFEPWDIRDPSSESDDEGRNSEEISTNSINMPFSVSVDPNFTPEFWSPLLSRRHTIDVTITLDDDPGSMTKLKLPLQVHTHFDGGDAIPEYV